MINAEDPPDSYSGEHSAFEVIPQAESRANDEMALPNEEDILYGFQPMNEVNLNKLNRIDDDDDEFDEKERAFDDPPPLSPSFEMHDWFDEIHSEKLGPPALLAALPLDSEQPWDFPIFDENMEYLEETENYSTLASDCYESGPLFLDDVPDPCRSSSELDAKVKQRRRNREQINAMTADEKTKVHREQNKISSENYRQKKKGEEAELEKQAESLRQENEEFRKSNQDLEEEYSKNFDDLQALEDSLEAPVTKTSIKKRQILEANIQDIEKELAAIAARKATLEEEPPKSRSQKWNSANRTNASQKCRENQKLRVAQLKLDIHDLKNSIKVQKAVRRKLQKALGVKSPACSPPESPPDSSSDEPPISSPPRLKRRGDDVENRVPAKRRASSKICSRNRTTEDSDLEEFPSENFEIDHLKIGGKSENQNGSESPPSPRKRTASNRVTSTNRDCTTKIMKPLATKKQRNMNEEKADENDPRYRIESPAPSHAFGKNREIFEEKVATETHQQSKEMTHSGPEVAGPLSPTLPPIVPPGSSRQPSKLLTAQPNESAHRTHRPPGGLGLTSTASPAVPTARAGLPAQLGVLKLSASAPVSTTSGIEPPGRLASLTAAAGGPEPSTLAYTAWGSSVDPHGSLEPPKGEPASPAPPDTHSGPKGRHC